MPRSWSEARKACRRHPDGRVGDRACPCRVGWRYRMGTPDPVTGRVGKPQWSQTFPTKRAADDDQTRVRKAIAEGTFTHDQGMTVGEHLDDWLARKTAAGRKLTTIEGYRTIIEARLKPAVGHHRLGRFTQHHAQAMLDRFAAEPSQGKGKGHRTITAGTLANIRACLRAALNDAMRQGRVMRNVAKLVELPPACSPAPVAIDDERMRLWLDYAVAVDDPLAPLWLCCSVYGPRRGELLGLRRTDVDTKGKLIRVRQELVDVRGEHACPHCGRTHKRLRFDTVKSAAGDRTWPLVPEVEAALMVLQLRQDAERELYGDDYADHGLVFAQPDGMPWRPDWVSREFKRLFVASGSAAGLDKVPSLKALRSTSVSALSAEGAPIEVVSKVTGHADDGVTREHYLSVSAERVRTEYEAISARLSGRCDRHGDHRASSGPETAVDGKEN